MRKFDIPLSGLSCMGCARKVERELTSQHQVNIHDLTPQHITLDSDSPFVDLEQSIQSLGYQAVIVDQPARKRETQQARQGTCLS